MTRQLHGPTWVVYELGEPETAPCWGGRACPDKRMLLSTLRVLGLGGSVDAEDAVKILTMAELCVVKRSCIFCERANWPE